MITTILTTVTHNEAATGITATIALLICAYAATLIQERIQE